MTKKKKTDAKQAGKPVGTRLPDDVAAEFEQIIKRLDQQSPGRVTAGGVITKLIIEFIENNRPVK